MRRVIRCPFLAMAEHWTILNTDSSSRVTIFYHAILRFVYSIYLRRCSESLFSAVALSDLQEGINIGSVITLTLTTTQGS